MAEASSRSPLRVRELEHIRALLEARDLAGASTASSKLVHLYPLDGEVRLAAARVALANGNRKLAGGQLFLVPGKRATTEDLPGSVELLAEFEKSVAADPLKAFLDLDLRDVPVIATLDAAVGQRLQSLLDQLEAMDYPVQRLDALMY